MRNLACKRNVFSNSCMVLFQVPVISFYEKTTIATEDSYPYTGRDGSCKSNYDTAIPRGGVTGFVDINSENDLLDAVTNVGPVSVAIEADQQSFQGYSSGVLTGNCGTNLDHGVLVVGFGTESGTNYWKVKNSWGATWGANGYVLIQRGVNKCGISQGPPSYPTVSGSPSPSPSPTPTPTPTPSPSPGTCHAISPVATDDWCQSNCALGNCPADLCACDSFTV